jgi:hypothetical protein
MSELISLLVKLHHKGKKDKPQSPGSKSEFPNTILPPKKWRPKKVKRLSYHQLPRSRFLTVLQTGYQEQLPGLGQGTGFVDRI